MRFIPSKLLLIRISLMIFFFVNAGYCAGKLTDDTLAVINKKIITADDFIKSYKDKLTKIGLNDNSETRQKYLMNLVNDELLIAEAKKEGLDKTGSPLRKRRTNLFN